MNEDQESAQGPAAESRLKMHLRLLQLAGDVYRVVTLRPSTRIGFSTNFYHQTWHIVTSQRGARLLARLLWGLSYQRQRGTVLLVHGSHLLPTPFEAERSEPFVIAPGGITTLNASSLRVLKDRLKCLGAPTRTIRWHSFGLDAVLRAWQSEDRQRAKGRLRWRQDQFIWRQEQMQHLGGFIVYSAPPAILRQQALAIHSLRVATNNRAAEMDYHFLAEQTSEGSWLADGEVQIFADYAERVAAATQARRDLVPNPNQPITSEELQEVVSRRRDRIKALRTRSRARQRAGGDLHLVR
jgi:hypothetical protein